MPLQRAPTENVEAEQLTKLQDLHAACPMLVNCGTVGETNSAGKKLHYEECSSL